MGFATKPMRWLNSPIFQMKKLRLPGWCCSYHSSQPHFLSPLFFPRSKKSHQTLVWVQRRGTVISTPVLSVFLSDSEVPGVVSRSSMTRSALFAQNGKIPARQVWQISSFPSADLCLRAWFEVPFLPGNPSRGGGGYGSRGSERCVGMTRGFLMSVLFEFWHTCFLWCDGSWIVMRISYSVVICGPKSWQRSRVIASYNPSQLMCYGNWEVRGRGRRRGLVINYIWRLKFTDTEPRKARSTCTQLAARPSRNPTST